MCNLQVDPICIEMVSHNKRKGVANDIIASALSHTPYNQDAQCKKLLVRHLNYDAQIKLNMK